MRKILLVLCAGWLMLHGTAARAEKFTVSYGIYAGGFRALDMQMQFDQAPAAYRLTMDAQPHGMIGTLLPWAGTYSTAGKISGNSFIPDFHQKISRWREDNSQASFAYKNGVLVSLQRSELEQGKMRKEDVKLDPEFHAGSLDILSGALQILGQATHHLPCNGAPVIYDGKQRFILKFTDRGTENLVANNYNMFSGTAVLCEIEMIPQKGFPKKPRGYYKIQEEARAKGQLPRVWLGQLWAGGPYVPVKMLVKSEYGAVFIHAQHLQR